MLESRVPRTAAACCTGALALVVVIAPPTPAQADPITFAVRGSASVTIADFTAPPPAQDTTSVDEIFGADDLALIESSLTGAGTTAGYSGSASTVITDAVIGAYAAATSAGSATAASFSSGGAGYIDYFTVLQPAGALVPMLFTLDPSYTIQTTGAGCGNVNAHVQVGGAGDPFIGSLSYVDSSCNPDSLVTSVELMVPTGTPFRVLLELSASAVAPSGQAGSATVDALNSLHLFADPVGSYNYSTSSGRSFSSAPTPVPEPATLLMFGSGFSVLAYRRRRTR